MITLKMPQLLRQEKFICLLHWLRPGCCWYFSNYVPLPEVFATLSLQFAGAILVGLGYNRLQKYFPTLGTIMPKFSMAGIIYFTLVTTAAGSESLMKVGGLLFIASVIHNAAGYFFGYWISRGVGMDICIQQDHRF